MPFSFDSSWCLRDITLYAIDEVDGKVLTALRPLRAFRIFLNMRLVLGSSQRLWFHFTRPNGFLSRAVFKFIEESMIMAFPLPPAVVSPVWGTHHMRIRPCGELLLKICVQKGVFVLSYSNSFFRVGRQILKSLLIESHL